MATPKLIKLEKLSNGEITGLRYAQRLFSSKSNAKTVKYALSQFPYYHKRYAELQKKNDRLVYYIQKLQANIEIRVKADAEIMDTLKDFQENFEL